MKLKFIFLLLFFISSDAMIIIQHAGVEIEYLRKKETFQGHDPFEDFTQEQRQTICEALIKVRSFVYLPGMSRRMPYGTSNIQTKGFQENFNVESLKYNEKIVNIQSTPVNVKMFPCTENRVNEVYLTYGFQSAFINAYVIIKTKYMNDSNLKIIGTLEKSATLAREANWNFHFWSIFNNSNSNLGLVSSFQTALFWPRTEYEHFHICCTIADALVRRNGFQLLHLMNLNIVYEIPRRYYLPKILVDTENKIRFNGLILPCTIHKHWAFPQFYLLRDPLCATSFYVLRPYGAIGLIVETKVDNVLVLTETLSISRSRST